MQARTADQAEPKIDIQALADRVEIEALRGEYTDAGSMRDYDRFASLFAPDASLRIPHAGIEFGSREEIRAGIERLQGLWAYFVQNTHPGAIRLEGDTAVGRAYIAEFGRMHGGSSHANHAIYHDRYRRTADGWKFAERVYEVRYVDNTPLEGSAPERAQYGTGSASTNDFSRTVSERLQPGGGTTADQPSTAPVP